MNSPIYSIHCFAFIFATLISLDAATQSDPLAPYLEIISENFNKAIQEYKDQINTTENKKLLENQQKASPKLTSANPFPCNLENIKLRSDTVPQNVNKIRPGDIDIIAGMGDSLSAGVGISATNLIQSLAAPQRARSWSAGGEGTWRTYLTLPNILKVFNSKLFGFTLPSTQDNEENAEFNVALSGAKSKAIPKMAENLVKKIKQDARVDLKNHWKMVTLMIGDNDFCSGICHLDDIYDSLKKHKEDLVAALKHLKENLPRTIVNIVPPPRLGVLREISKSSPYCGFLQFIACPCMYYNETQVNDVMVKWQQVDLEVSNLPEFHSEDFTVISHTFTLNYTFPKTKEGKIDYGFLAPDCFHFSENGQARFANDIWNSLLEPYGKKSTDGTPLFSKFNCPSEDHPYIYTKENSI